jgi:hypothetical protein
MLVVSVTKIIRSALCGIRWQTLEEGSTHKIESTKVINLYFLIILFAKESISRLCLSPSWQK